jgi:quinol monooxygenase YgiN
MYGSIGIFKVTPGNEAAAVEKFDSWWRDRSPKVKGSIAGVVHRNDANPSEIILSVVFESKAAYEANANDPAQDAWYQGLRALLSADPRWMDGEVMSEHHR